MERKTALVTGACVNTGYAIAQKFISENWNVVITGRSQERVDEAVKKLSEEKKKQFKIWMVILAILPMFLLFVLRYKYVGADTIGYVRFFQSFSYYACDSFAVAARSDFGHNTAVESVLLYLRSNNVT